VQLHVLDRVRFYPGRTAVAVLCAARRLTPEDRSFWLEARTGSPPPIDLIHGSEELRYMMDEGRDARSIVETWGPWEEAWRVERLEFLMYTGRPSR
jgi:uncharacterized protein YbbC (DUF1343 family)